MADLRHRGRVRRAQMATPDHRHSHVLIVLPARRYSVNVNLVG
jgi:hypothetical protein